MSRWLTGSVCNGQAARARLALVSSSFLQPRVAEAMSTAADVKEARTGAALDRLVAEIRKIPAAPAFKAEFGEAVLAEWKKRTGKGPEELRDALTDASRVPQPSPPKTWAYPVMTDLEALHVLVAMSRVKWLVEASDPLSGMIILMTSSLASEAVFGGEPGAAGGKAANGAVSATTSPPPPAASGDAGAGSRPPAPPAPQVDLLTALTAQVGELAKQVAALSATVNVQESSGARSSSTGLPLLADQVVGFADKWHGYVDGCVERLEMLREASRRRWVDCHRYGRLAHLRERDLAEAETIWKRIFLNWMTATPSVGSLHTDLVRWETLKLRWESNGEVRAEDFQRELGGGHDHGEPETWRAAKRITAERSLQLALEKACRPVKDNPSVRPPPANGGAAVASGGPPAVQLTAGQKRELRQWRKMQKSKPGGGGGGAGGAGAPTGL